MKTRRILSVFCCLALVISAAACGKGGKQTEKSRKTAEMGLLSVFSDHAYFDSKAGVTRLECWNYSVLCDEATAEAYPNLAETLRKKCETQDAEDKEFYASYKTELAKNANQTNPVEFYSTTRTVVRRADSRAVSLLSEIRSFTGGIHGYGGYFPDNYDPATGESIRLSDVVRDQNKLNELLLDDLNRRYPDLSLLREENPFENYDMTQLETDTEHSAYLFSLDPDGLCLYFNPYDLGSYADGMQIIKLLYADHPDLFVKDYAVSGSYASQLLDMNRHALGRDRTVCDLHVYSQEDENGEYNTFLYIYKNEKILSHEMYHYSTDCYLMHTDDNLDFLYIFTGQDNDATVLTVVDLNGDTPVFVKDLGYAVPLADVPGREDEWAHAVITQSSDFDLTRHCDLLASFGAGFDTYTGADGLPVLPADGYYRTPEGMLPFQTAFPFKADIVDESGAVKEKDYEIPAGTELTPVRTDAEKILDMNLPDGRMVRLVLTRTEEDYSATVNGQLKEDQAFTELRYAG